METRSKRSYCIGRRAGKSGTRLPVRNQASPEHPSGSQNREKPNLGPLDSPSPKKKQKPKRIKWVREDHIFMRINWQMLDKI